MNVTNQRAWFKDTSLVLWKTTFSCTTKHEVQPINAKMVKNVWPMLQLRLQPENTHKNKIHKLVGNTTYLNNLQVN